MTIRMLINAMAPNELRIAIVEDGELVELDIEASETSTLKGNVYRGVIHNVEASLEAAFVDIGRHKQGFLPFSEVSSSQYHRPWSGSGRPRITDVLKRGQEITVQVAKDAIGEKGATLTTYLSLPGRYTVLMPDSDAGGISRKIEDERVRRRMRLLSQKIKKPDGCGFIVRTAGFGQTRLAIQRDLDKVVEQWRKLIRASDMARAPSVIHSEPDLIGRTLRDFFSDEIDEVLIDSEQEFRNAKDYFRDVMPAYEERLVHYTNPIPIFSYHRVEEQIEETFERQVKMPSGGSIVIDETEALVAIDVNSGKMTSEGGHEKTVFKTNREAAEVIARQLKLRDLGGIVVIDFIDMEENKHKREVERLLGEAAKADKARYKISKINSKGLCVLTRQRIRQGMRKAFQHRCPTCSGTGWLRSSESHSLSLIRRLRARLAQGGVGEVRVLTHRETAEYLLNHRRADLLDLERKYACRVIVAARAEMDRAKDEVTFLSNREVLDEMTHHLPAREERRSKRKRRKPRRASDPGGEGPPPVVPAESEADDRIRRRKKRRRPRGSSDEARPEVNGQKPYGAPDSEITTSARSLRSMTVVEDDGSDFAFVANDVGVSGDDHDGLSVVQAIAVADAVQSSDGRIEPSAIFRAVELAEEEAGAEPTAGAVEEDSEGLVDDEERGRKRRRRRRGRRRRPANGVVEDVKVVETEVASPPPPPVPKKTPKAADPEVREARKALLVRIFGSR